MCDAAYARHVPERLSSGSVLLEALYQVFDLLPFTFYQKSHRASMLKKSILFSVTLTMINEVTKSSI